MELEWKIAAMGAYLTAAVSEDADGFNAVIAGEIVDAPRIGDSDIPERVMRNEQYGPVTVIALSVEELKRVVADKIEADIGRIIRWPD